MQLVRHVVVLILISGFASLVEAKDYDTRDTLYAADVFHIMAKDQDTLRALHAQLVKVPTEQRLEQFKALAKRHSRDEASAKNGGSLGTVETGYLDPAFENVVFSQPVGEVSAPFATQFGWHITLTTRLISTAVASICREGHAAMRTRLGNALEDGPLKSQLQTIRAKLGPSWSGPKQVHGDLGKLLGGLGGGSENVVYLEEVQPTKFPKEHSVKVHFEYEHPQLIFGSQQCFRSSSAMVYFDCETAKWTFSGDVRFEGRAGIGPIENSPPLSTEKRTHNLPILLNSALAEAYTDACFGKR